MSIEGHPENTKSEANGTTAEHQFDALLRLTNLVNRADAGVLSSFALTLDVNGNLTSDATFTYQYDTANQLTNVTRKSDSVTVLQCRYDALGRRVEAIRADVTVDRYVYFPGSFLVLAVLWDKAIKLLTKR